MMKTQNRIYFICCSPEQPTGIIACVKKISKHQIYGMLNMAKITSNKYQILETVSDAKFGTKFEENNWKCGFLDLNSN